MTMIIMVLLAGYLLTRRAADFVKAEPRSPRPITRSRCCVGKPMTTHGPTSDAGAEGHRLLGAFARIFVRDSADALAEAFVADQLVQVQLNLSALGLPTIPTAEEFANLDTAAIQGRSPLAGG